MSPHIALLRAVNVGGRKVLKDDLLGLARDLGFGEAKTLLASGNLVIWGRHEGGAALEKALEDGLEARMGLRTDFMVRAPAELRGVIDANPFREQAVARPNHLLVSFLKSPIDQGTAEVLRAAITGPEEIHTDGRTLYIDFKDGIAESTLDRDWKKTKRAPLGTMRNWNTVLKLAAMVAA
ncbi:DUF1697 domain-containing protein [Caulobacter segnis]|uniref:DUF1697 domain-containing protein n=1 Tax=Caulobacter segnis TaxID=88688 RepID=UPI00285EC223|nr:DUF1697 domain-containing protein [Caulobacter segnis]MDR6627196.1 uncharacterized protein (DUF1697 family) [Caulobacter segnis]